MLGASIPENLGGLGKDFITATIVNEGLGGGFLFPLRSRRIPGSAPYRFFILEHRNRRKNIPKLASGEWKGSYGLTEPNSGSDALGAKTSAVLSKDGKHLFTQRNRKCWITNGGFRRYLTRVCQSGWREIYGLYCGKGF